MRRAFFLPAMFLLGVLILCDAVPSWTQTVLPAPEVSAATTLSLPNAPAAAPGVVKEPATPLSQGDSPASAETGVISGTVTDVYGDVVPGASVVVEGPDPNNRQSKVADDNGFFNFTGLKSGVVYHVTISSKGFDNWVSQPITLAAGQYYDLTGIKLKLADAVASVTVSASVEQIAVQQVHIAEQQRVLGFIPNFYVVYDSQNAVPLTTKLKFQMAYKVSIDPITIVGAFFLGGINQAADTPDFVQGAKGYAQRVGTVYADGLTDIMFGGAILPSLLHQDPRYFYQGTGPIKSRMLHAMSNPFICKGDNGKWQPNYSSIGGDLISASISNAYYPSSNRGLGLTLENVAISTAERTVSSLFQEFVLRKLTPSANRQN
jgi:Carboxypeptidase regulatory-like domain